MRSVSCSSCYHCCYGSCWPPLSLPPGPSALRPNPPGPALSQGRGQEEGQTAGPGQGVEGPGRGDWAPARATLPPGHPPDGAPAASAQPPACSCPTSCNSTTYPGGQVGSCDLLISLHGDDPFPPDTTPSPLLRLRTPSLTRSPTARWTPCLGKTGGHLLHIMLVLQPRL